MKIRKLIAMMMAAILLLSLAGCGKKGGSSSQGDSSDAEQTKDYPFNLGDTILSEQPQKVVSLSPALTEIIFEMGYDSQLVGVSDYCDYPQEADSLDRCGGPQQINFDAVEDLGPDLIVTSTPLIESELIKLQQMDIEVLVLPRAASLDELKSIYVNLARALQGDSTGRAAGEEFYTALSDRLDELADLGKAYAAQNGGKLSVIMLRIPDFTMATGDTFENKLLENLGFKNLAASYGDWVFPKEDKAKLTPDLIISDNAVTIPDLEKNDTYKKTDAVIKDRVVNVDMCAFERQSPRMFDELEKIADFAYGAGESSGEKESESQS